ncbi:MAG: hypothetical protein OXE95_07645 [Chloroflexi bacterium]|nr:hypothetical protein [Chloroflexota bacterium]MCY4247430.1 hypothetical protein [Chloroflexota bacterium]
MPSHHQSELEQIVNRWEQRHEWRLLSRSMPRSLILALLLSLAAGAAGYFWLGLRAEQLALIAAGLCAFGFAGNLLRTVLFPRDLPTRARYFDIEFNLGERVSTAFELLSGRIGTHPDLAARQLADTLAQARAINPSERIALDFRRGELVALLALAVALLGMIALPAIVGAELLDQPPAAIELAREDIREMIETTAKDPDLNEIDRQDVLDALEIALERLEETEIGQEEAFAAMSQLEARLDELELELGETMELDQSALQAGLEALADFAPPLDESGSEQAGDDFAALSEALEQLAQDARDMSADERLNAAAALDAAADELSALDAALEERLDDMAQSLQEGRQDLSEQLDAAQEAVAQERQQNQGQQNAQQTLQEQAERAQEVAESIARQQRQQGDQQTEDAQAGEADPSDSGQPRAGQEGDQQSDQARPGANQGRQPAQRNAESSGAASQRSQDSRASGGGTGQGDPSNLSMAGSGGEDRGAETSDRSAGRGAIEYEALYSPSGIGGGGENEVRLQTDPGDTTLAEGEFDDNPLGESRVRYDAVFNAYQQAANRALESDYVPLGLRDVVREYFTSLEPGG